MRTIEVHKPTTKRELEIVYVLQRGDNANDSSDSNHRKSLLGLYNFYILGRSFHIRRE